MQSHTNETSMQFECFCNLSSIVIKQAWDKILDGGKYFRSYINPLKHFSTRKGALHAHNVLHSKAVLMHPSIISG